MKSEAIIFAGVLWKPSDPFAGQLLYMTGKPLSWASFSHHNSGPCATRSYDSLLRICLLYLLLLFHWSPKSHVKCKFSTVKFGSVFPWSCDLLVASYPIGVMFIFVSITTGTWLCWRLLNSQINKVCHNQIYHLLYLLLLLSDIKLHEVQNVYDHIDGSMNQKNLCCQKSYLDSHQHHKNPIILHCVGLYQYLTFI